VYQLLHIRIFFHIATALLDFQILIPFFVIGDIIIVMIVIIMHVQRSNMQYDG